MSSFSMPSAKIRELEARERRRRLSASLDEAREEFVAAVLAGAGGKEAHARLSDRTDAFLIDIVDHARPLTSTGVAIAALGGYGRRTLCLHSDIDLLILVDGGIGRAEERFVKAVLHPLWDLKLTVGHHVRESAEIGRFERDNPEFLLALADARFLAGDPALFEPIRAAFRRPGTAWSGPILDALVELVAERHRRFNGTLYQLEPDVKDAPGGLRDITATRWIKALADSRAARLPADIGRLDEAEDFLLRIRSLLHCHAGRNMNVLTHQLQETVAASLGYPGGQAHQRVEALMGDYFRHARAVTRLLDRCCAVVRPSPVTGTPRPISDNLEIGPDGVRFVDRQRAAGDPVSWVRAFRGAIEHGCGMAPDALDGIEQAAGRYDAGAWVATEADRRLLLDLLRPRPGLYARLSEMHDSGLLGRIFPEFERIHCRVIRDFYHKYTVDEHTLLTLRGLESLQAADSGTREHFRTLLSAVREPALLSLALLYHDVGKWRDEDHHLESVRMAQAMLERLALPPEARQTVEFLIHHHLQMSRVAFRRDTEDPDVVRDFAGLVATEEWLKLLCLMTFADVQAVSPDTLTPWKEELLWRLYVDTYNHLTRAYGDELIERNQVKPEALVAGRPADIPEAELSRFLAGLPRRYLAIFDREAIYRHVRLARNIRADEVHLSLDEKAGTWELTVVTLDKPSLFANICGVLAYFGMNILRGQALTTPDGLVLDVFQFTDEEGFFRHNPGATPEFKQLLADVVAGAVDVAAILRGKERSILYSRPQRVAPVVYFDNEHSRRYTVLEIIADDALGLLHRISRVISGHGCDVDLVLISTEGDKAIDVFHVTKGAATLDEATQRALGDELARMLGGGHEAH